MGVSYDPKKCSRNVRERGLSFEGRLHMLVFTPRGGDVHVISLRKANRREIKRYEEEKEIPRE